MKRWILLLTTALVTACGSDGNLILSYSGLQNDTVLVEYGSFRQIVEGRQLHPDMQVERDTVVLQRGRLVLQLPIDEPQLVRVRPFQYRIVSTDGRIFFGDGGTLNVILQGDEQVQVQLKRQRKGHLKARVKGSELNADIQYAFNSIREARQAYENHAAKIGRLQREGKGSADSLRAHLSDLKTVLQKRYIDYIEANPSKEASAYVLYELGGRNGMAYYDKLDRKLFVGTFRPVAELVERFREIDRIRKEARQHLTNGEPAPDFTLKDRDGNAVTLSSLRGKWVVVEFWGSWANRSQRGMEALKHAYKQHKGRLEIVSVACNDQYERWCEQLDRYDLPWINVIERAGVAPAESVALRFGVSSYPTKYIITPTGTIHRIAQGEHPSFYQELHKVVK